MCTHCSSLDLYLSHAPVHVVERLLCRILIAAWFHHSTEEEVLPTVGSLLELHLVVSAIHRPVQSVDFRSCPDRAYRKLLVPQDAVRQLHGVLRTEKDAVTGRLFVLSYAAILAVPHSYSLQFSWLYPFFWMGYFLKRKFQWMTDHMKALTLVSAVAYGVFYMLCHQDMETLLALLPSMSSIASAPLLLLSKFVLASAGSFLCIGLCHYAEKWVVPHDIIAKIAGYGKYTLGVYIIQTILIYEIYADVVGETAQGHGVLYTLWVSVFMLALCLMLIKFLARYKFIDRLLFGGQYYKDRT